MEYSFNEKYKQIKDIFFSDSNVFLVPTQCDSLSQTTEENNYENVYVHSLLMGV